MSVPVIHKNITEYFENNASKSHAEIKKYINLIIRDTLLILAKTTIGLILNLIQLSIRDSSTSSSEEKPHNHHMVDDCLISVQTIKILIQMVIISLKRRKKVRICILSLRGN